MDGGYVFDGRSVVVGGCRRFLNIRGEIDEVRAAAIVRGVGTSAVATRWMGIASLGTFCSGVVTRALYTSWNVATILGTMTNWLTNKSLGGAESLESLNRDFEVEQVVYLEDIFVVRSLADDC